MFTKEVRERLGYYVYRLVDPRNGNTFYVGKGEGNRVFNHVNRVLKGSNEDSESLKYKTIQGIIDSGLEVIHIIHRWGMSEQIALAVEAALIDCYPGLTNIQSGYGVDYGVTSTDILERSLAVEEYDDNTENRYIIIKVKQETVDEVGRGFATQYAWKANIERAKTYPYVFSVTNGIVKEIYGDLEWRNSDIENRIEFNGAPLDADSEISRLYLNKRIPKRFRKRGLSNPFIYSDVD